MYACGSKHRVFLDKSPEVLLHLIFVCVFIKGIFCIVHKRNPIHWSLETSISLNVIHNPQTQNFLLYNAMDNLCQSSYTLPIRKFTKCLVDFEETL